MNDHLSPEQLIEVADLKKQIVDSFKEMNRIRTEQPDVFRPIDTAFENLFGKRASNAEQLYWFAFDNGLNMLTGKEDID